MEEEKVSKNKEKSIFREIMEWVVCLVAAFVIAVIIKYYIFTPTLVQQNSMTPTILNGERVLINRIVRTFKLPIYRGDIITFEKPSNIGEGIEIIYDEDEVRAQYDEQTGFKNFIVHDLLEIKKISYIKRVIGIGGDHVRISKSGEVYVNDQKLNETYLVEGLKTPESGPYTDVVVPEGYVFVMGDNRIGSSDSRAFGCIPLDKVEGRVTYRIWPLNKFGKIDK